MIRNYLKVAIRSIFRNKLTAFINMAGLALAMAAALLIYLFINDELKYEKYHAKADRIYRVTRSFHSQEGVVNLHLANVAPPIGPLLKNDFGEIEVAARTINFSMVIGLEENGEMKMVHNEEDVFLAEPDIFKIFDIAVESGDPQKALSRPFTIMLSESSAKRYFNSENIIGKRLRANSAFDLEVTGVFKDFPDQAHWHPAFLISFSTLEDENIYGRTALETNWGNNAFGTYLLIEEGTNIDVLEKKLPAFIDKHFGNYARANWGTPAEWTASKSTTLFLQKLTDIHLRSHLDDEIEVNGNINTVYMMGIIGVFIILIACFNFINLSTASATNRAKEVGLRKVVGAFKNQLVMQYLSESVLISFFALALGMLLAVTGLDIVNDFTGKHLTLNPVSNLPLSGTMVFFAITIGVLAGCYPAFVISAFKPALTLKGQQGSATGKGTVRKILVVAQFSISIVLIIATFITMQQLDFLNNRPLGYDKDQVITLPYYEELADHYDSFYNELTKSSVIKNVTRSSRIPTGRLLDSYGDAKVLQGDSLRAAGISLKSLSVDDQFFNTYGIDLAAGRGFSKAVPTDDSLAFIINTAAAKEIGWANEEEHINEDFEYADVRGKLIGVVQDFHFESLHQKIAPIVFLVKRNNYNALSVKIAENNMREGLAYLERIWKEFLPARPFDYQFLSEKYRALYDGEQKQARLFTAFAGMAIFIASLGLFGLATFHTMQRIKEIGIRKVLGASVPNILALLSKEIVVLILVANLIAWPLAWFMMNSWLNTFAYHINLNILAFVLSAFAALVIALLTVSAQTIRAAMRNPAKTLRYE